GASSSRRRVGARPRDGRHAPLLEKPNLPQRPSTSPGPTL
ncbi:MAG: hypothetical protein AVDCRST_MAG55-1060, partial [uncultured Rubrobacteraceae bacterium]